MDALDRYNRFKDESIDYVLLKIQNGEIKAGKYANLVKVSKHAKLKGKEFFTDGRESDDNRE